MLSALSKLRKGSEISAVLYTKLNLFATRFIFIIEKNGVFYLRVGGSELCVQYF